MKQLLQTISPKDEHLEAYKKRRISATDIVRDFVLGKKVRFANGEISQPLTKKETRNVFIGRVATTLIYEDYTGEKMYIIEVIEEFEEPTDSDT